MPFLRRLIRIPLLLLHVLLGLAIVFLGFPRHPKGPLGDLRRAVVRAWLRGVTRIFGLRIQVRGRASGDAALVVSNHISWLDIPVLGGLCDIVFLSKAEVRRWPLVGSLATRTGTLYIQRGGKNAANEAADVITFSLIRGQSVLVFPEGTTTHGETVHRFHPRLFAAAQLSERPVQPVGLRYLDTHGERHRFAPWVDDAPLHTHVWRLLGERHVQVEVIFSPLITSRGVDRRGLAELAHAQVAATIGHGRIPAAESPGT
jgi:1-acyl-sn-glycerol-3-phosphate acyltransferase